MRGFLIWFLAAAVAGLWLFTLAGLLAPVAPAFDLLNHLRLHILEASLVLFVLVAWARSRAVTWAAAALVVLNAILTAPAFLLAADGLADGAEAEPLTFVLANMAGRDGRKPSLAGFLEREDPDLVLLLEADPVAEPVLEGLGQRYPHRIGCSGNHRCRMVLLSKLELEDADAMPRSSNAPPHIKARVQTTAGPLNILGAHVARPFNTGWHGADMAAVARLIGQSQAPLLVAGDFNATPWSWSLTRLQRATALRRHRTLGATWPNVDRISAQLLIDHVLVSPGIAVLEAESGPDLGSDHLPTIARIAIKPGRAGEN
jgi:endonuclease/exonuclease/phosphatase (EEP) superfamily protein YafD